MTSSLDWIKDHEVEPLPILVSSVPGAFKEAWETDNSDRIEQLMGLDDKLLTQENLDKALILAMKTNPLPGEALDKFITLDKEIGQRLIRVAKERAFSQWRPDEVFDFLAKHDGIDTSEKELFVRIVVDQAYLKIQQDAANALSSYSAMEFLVAALEHPYSRQAVIDRHSRDSWVLLTVAINKRNTQLLEHIEDLEGALRDVLSQRNRTAMVWGDGDKIDTIRRAWSRWEWMVEKSPSLSLAWQTVKEKDAVASQRAREWIKTWIPGGKFAGSPLEKWSQAPDDFHTHPLHVGMLGKLSFEAVNMDSKALQGALMGSFGIFSGEGRAMKNLLNLRDVLAKYQKNNPSKSGSKWNSHGWINELCVIHPHLLSIAGASGHSALHLAATGTQAGKDELARVLMDPRTSDELFSKENCREIMAWLAADKRWNLWRDTDGNTLAHSWIQRQSKDNISWTMLKKLGRMFPDQLTSPNNNGVCLLDRKDLIEEKRLQQLVRMALKKTAGRHQAKKASTPKM